AGISSTASAPTDQNVQAIVSTTDPGWKYCTLPDKAKKHELKCNFCEKLCRGGITRIKLHLAHIPKCNVAKCERVPADVKAEMIEMLAKKNIVKENKTKEWKRARDKVNLDHSEGEASSEEEGGNSVVVVHSGRVGSTSSSKGGPKERFCKSTPEEVVAAKKGASLSNKVQTKLSTQKREERRDRACEYICQFFYEAGIAHNTVTLHSFDLMLEAVGDFGRSLKGPSAYEMSSPFLQKAKNKVTDSFKNYKEQRALTGCSLMTDAWTDKKGRGVMNIVVHSAYGVCFLDSVDCSSVKKDGKFIFDLVDKWIEEIGEKNVVQVVTDNASVNWTAATLLKAKRPSILWTGCAAHTIDLMLEDIGKIKKIDDTIVRARSLTTFLYSHKRVLALMRKCLGKDLVRAGITRFATAYLNLKSLLDNKKELGRLFRENELNEMGYLKKDKGKNASKVVRSETFWKNIDSAVNFFEPLANVLRRMDSDVPAMGFLHGCLLDAKKDIAKRFDNDVSRYKDVWEIIDKRWDNKLKTPLHLASYYLNPYYYYPNKLEIELDGTFREGLVTCVTKMVDDLEIQDKIFDELNMYQDGLGSFGKDIATRQRRNEKIDPAKWWLNHGTSSPNLRKLATRILGLTCSSSGCERNWSDFEQVHSKRRNRLLHDRMSDLVFVKFNSRLKHKRENKTRDPIEKQVVDILEDDDNEFITGVALAADDEQEEPEDPQAEGEKDQEQDVAPAEHGKRKRVVRPQIRKRVKKITDINAGKQSVPEIVAASSSDTENDDDHDVDMGRQSAKTRDSN
ncbi:hypothetical protein E2562_014305, partial [Oryza meyeriana var. granulata]